MISRGPRTPHDRKRQKKMRRLFYLGIGTIYVCLLVWLLFFAAPVVPWSWQR